MQELYFLNNDCVQNICSVSKLKITYRISITHSNYKLFLFEIRHSHKIIKYRHLERFQHLLTLHAPNYISLNSLLKLTSLQSLTLDYPSNITSLRTLTNLTYIKYENIHNCESDISNLVNLRKIRSYFEYPFEWYEHTNLTNFTKVEYFYGCNNRYNEQLRKLKNLRYLSANSVKNYATLLTYLTCIERLSCKEIYNFPSKITHVKLLFPTKMTLLNNDTFKYLYILTESNLSLFNFASLQTLIVSVKNSSIDDVIDLNSSIHLKYLSIDVKYHFNVIATNMKLLRYFKTNQKIKLHSEVCNTLTQLELEYKNIDPAEPVNSFNLIEYNNLVKLQSDVNTFQSLLLKNSLQKLIVINKIDYEEIIDLSECKNLTHISISKCLSINLRNLTKLKILSMVDINDVLYHEHLISLKIYDINIPFDKEIIDRHVNIIKNIINLKTIKFTVQSIRKLDWNENKLDWTEDINMMIDENINLEKYQIDVNNFSTLSRLIQLKLSNIMIKNLKLLTKLKKLKITVCQWSNDSDITDIEYLTNMEDIYIENHRDEDRKIDLSRMTRLHKQCLDQKTEKIILPEHLI